MPLGSYSCHSVFRRSFVGGHSQIHRPLAPFLSISSPQLSCLPLDSHNSLLYIFTTGCSNLLFFPKTIREQNGLPLAVVESGSVSSFQAVLAKFVN